MSRKRSRVSTATSSELHATEDNNDIQEDAGPNNSQEDVGHNNIDEGPPRRTSAPRTLRSIEEEPHRAVGKHTPMKLGCLSKEESASGTNRTRRRRCIVCKKESSYYCVQCNVALHITNKEATNCWCLYHC
jgi:hypothetical protein